MVCCLCPDTPPDKVSAKGSRGGAHKTMLNMQEAPHQFAIGLKDSCCAEPCCCILSGAGAPCGFTACWARGAVLDKYYQGTQDFMCCQGYLPRCCCLDLKECCKGTCIGLYCEGCLCPIFSISLARIHLMQTK